MVKARHLSAGLRRALQTFPVVLVTGARQTGKTTLLRSQCATTHRYVSLDEPDQLARAQADPKAFFAALGEPLILDEIQHAPTLLPYVKALVDADRRPGRFVLTGSQSFPLMRGVSESLAGRVAVLQLDPFTVGEWQGAPALDLEQLLATVFEGDARPALPVGLGDWLLHGGYPEPALRTVDRQQWFGSYFMTYLQRDLRDLLQVGDLAVFQRFVRLCAARSGRLLEQTGMASDLGVAVPTVRRWLSVLEASQLVQLVEPWSVNFGKRLRKAPKLVFLDAALAAWLQGLHTEEAILHGPAAGALVETAVAAEWIKVLRHHGPDLRLHHWSVDRGREVDLVLEWDGRLYGIEVKATATPLPGHADALRRWLQLAGPRARGAVFCQVPQPIPLAPGVRAVPWHLAYAAART